MEYGRFQGLLDQRDQTAYAVAQATGIPASTFSDWKSGKSKPKIEKLMKLADYFGVSIEYFLTEEKEEA